MSILLRNAALLDGKYLNEKLDVLVEEGRIAAIGTEALEGTLTVGKEANLIAVAGTVDLSFDALRTVPFVMHYGTVIKNML